MTKLQYKRLIKGTSHIELNGEIFTVIKTEKHEPGLVAYFDSGGQYGELVFTTEELLSGQVEGDGCIYIKRKYDVVGIEFLPLMLVQVFQQRKKI